LEISPARLVALTGLTTGHHHRELAAFALASHVAPAGREAFAAATRLSDAEASGLFLSVFSQRYRSTAPSAAAQRGTLPTPAEAWLFTRSSRYCPECLAGDGSQIQRQLGGPWRKTWRIPVVFACTEHQRFLEHLCPACKQPVLHHRSTNLLRWRDTSLHPTRCRSFTRTRPGRSGGPVIGCEYWLGKPSRCKQVELTLPLLDLRRRFLTLLDPAGPETIECLGTPTTPSQYFTDLRLISYLISATWPLAHDRVCDPALAAALDKHLNDQQRKATTQNRLGRDHVPNYVLKLLHKTPPLPARASAALRSTADELLHLRSPEHFVDIFSRLILSDRVRPGESLWHNTTPLDKADCSPQVRGSLARLDHGIPRTRLAGSPTATSAQTPDPPSTRPAVSSWSVGQRVAVLRKISGGYGPRRLLSWISSDTGRRRGVAGQVFADEELEYLRGFPEIGQDELFRFFTLTQTDIAFISPGRGRGPADRLGLAIALCTLPWLGFVPDKVATAPPVAVARLAEQLGVDPNELRTCGNRAKTRIDHLRLVAQYMGWRAAVHDRAEGTGRFPGRPWFRAPLASALASVSPQDGQARSWSR
jgi:hypothetical protein